MHEGSDHRKGLCRHRGCCFAGGEGLKQPWTLSEESHERPLNRSPSIFIPFSSFCGGDEHAAVQEHSPPPAGRNTASPAHGSTQLSQNPHEGRGQSLPRAQPPHPAPRAAGQTLLATSARWCLGWYEKRMGNISIDSANASQPLPAANRHLPAGCARDGCQGCGRGEAAHTSGHRHFCAIP